MREPVLIQNPHLPDYSHNMSFVGWSDQGGRGDGVQVMVSGGYAYVGHMFSKGFSVIDVRDPRWPVPVAYIAAPPGTWCLHLQTYGDLLLVINAADLFSNPAFADESNYYSKSIGEVLRDQRVEFSAGMRVYDISDRANPREIAFMPVNGVGLHRIWYDGGRYAYASALIDGFRDYILVTIDLQDPAKPQIVGQWALQGMKDDEQPSWERGRRFALHHAIVREGRAYGSWRDGGLTIHDVSDPTAPALLAHRNWSPPFGGGTHTALPLPDRDLVVVLDEAIADDCEDGVKHTWIVDVRDPTNPVTISTLPVPGEEEYCRKGSHFGPHNLHENRSGSFQSSEIIFATYQNAGVRAFDLRDPFHPVEVAAFVPPAPEKMYDTRPGRPQVIQSTDVFVDAEGLAYVTDYNAGLYILQYEGPRR